MSDSVLDSSLELLLMRSRWARHGTLDIFIQACRQANAQYNADCDLMDLIAGVLLEQEKPRPLRNQEKMLNSILESDMDVGRITIPRQKQSCKAVNDNEELPSSLVSIFGKNLALIQWEYIAKHIETAVAIDKPVDGLFMYRLQAGAPLAPFLEGGDSLLLVLNGGIVEDGNLLGRGAVILSSELTQPRIRSSTHGETIILVMEEKG